MLIPVNATIITNIGLTIFADTIACPKISVPTIPSVGPTGAGVLIEASRIISKAISIIKSSISIENGTFSRAPEIENSRSVGIISWWNVVIAIYKPGNNTENITAGILKNLRSNV